VDIKSLKDLKNSKADENVSTDQFLSVVESAESLGKMIRENREKKNISQQELADFAGVSRAVIVDLENAKRDMKLSNVLKVVQASSLQLHLSNK
jgi:predicted transcriptional regulator